MWMCWISLNCTFSIFLSLQSKFCLMSRGEWPVQVKFSRNWEPNLKLHPSHAVIQTTLTFTVIHSVSSAPYHPQNSSSFSSQTNRQCDGQRRGSDTQRTHAWQIHQRCLPSQSPLPWLPGPGCHSDYTNSKHPLSVLPCFQPAVTQPAPCVHWGSRCQTQDTSGMGLRHSHANPLTA